MNDYDRIDVQRTERPVLRGFVLLLLAFIAGSLVMGWALTQWDTAAPYLSWMHPDTPDDGDNAQQPQPSAPQPLVTVPQADAIAVEHRIAELEDRLDRIAARADAASGNADRAEGLLVAFAARRAIDRGLQLGYIEGLLRERFGQSQPQAVATIITAARKPVTLDELRGQLDTLAPEIGGAGPNASWWDSMKRELAGMIVIRHAELPSVRPDDRLERARHALEAGYVDRALAEVSRLPARDKATDWIAAARRYISAHNALDLVETAALLDPTRASPPPPAAPAPKPVPEHRKADASKA